MAALGLTNGQIGHRLHVSVHAVKFHLAGDLPEARGRQPDRSRGRVPSCELDRAAFPLESSALAPMDLALFFRVLWRFKVIVLVGLSLAFALSFLSYVKVDFGNGFKMSSGRTSSGRASKLFVTDPDFTLGSSSDGGATGPRRGCGRRDRMLKLTALYMQLATADPVLVLMAREEPIDGIVQTFPITSTGDSRGDPLPMMTCSAISATPERAHRLARRHIKAFLPFLRRDQERRGVSPGKRVKVEIVRQPQAPALLVPRKKTRPIVVFLTVAIATFGLAFILENMRPRVRAVPDQQSGQRTKPPGAGPRSGPCERCSGEQSAGRPSRRASSSARSPCSRGPSSPDPRSGPRAAGRAGRPPRDRLQEAPGLAGTDRRARAGDPVRPDQALYLARHLPFELEAYRVYVAVVATMWLGALLVDPSAGARERPRGPDLPLRRRRARIDDLQRRADHGAGRALGGDEAAHVLRELPARLLPDRQRGPDAEQVDRIVRMLGGGGAIVAALSIVESNTGFNAFDRLDSLLPMLQAVPVAETGERGGNLRVMGSAQGPIALGAAFAMMLPLGAYLALKTRRWYWWAAVGLLGLGAMATLSRTSILMLIVILVVLLWLRPQQVKPGSGPCSFRRSW